jgi:hypothetical protein
MIALLLFLLLQPTPPAIHVVSAASDVLPGQAFSVTITVFGDVGDVTLDTGGLEVVSSDGDGVLWRAVSRPAHAACHAARGRRRAMPRSWRAGAGW